MRQWSVGRVDTEEIYPLATLLRLREQEDRQARYTLAEASVAHSKSLVALDAGETLVRQQDENLVAFQIEASGRRSMGYTIADRRADAQEEDALLRLVRQSEKERESCLKEVRRVGRLMERCQEKWEEVRHQLEAAQRHYKLWRRRLERRMEDAEEEDLNQSLRSRELDLLGD